MSTRSSSSCPKAIAGAWLRIVVAPTARARLKNAVMVGSGISNWLTAMSPLARTGPPTSSAFTKALAPGTTTMVLSALAKGDDGGSGVRLGRLLDEGEVYALRGEKRL